jgi:hypothetical protein
MIQNPPESKLESGAQVNEMGNFKWIMTQNSELQFKNDLRWYFSKMFKAIGHQDKIKYHFYRNLLELKYIDEYDYCMLVYKI